MDNRLKDIADFRRHSVGTFQRRAVRQLYDDEKVALIFDGKERGRDRSRQSVGAADYANENDKKHPAQANQQPHGRCIGVRKPVEARVEPAEKEERTRRAMPKKGGAERRTQSQRVEGGNSDRDRHRQRELIV